LKTALLPMKVGILTTTIFVIHSSCVVYPHFGSHGFLSKDTQIYGIAKIPIYTWYQDDFHTKHADRWIKKTQWFDFFAICFASLRYTGLPTCMSDCFITT
jgi:hypothetical protein